MKILRILPIALPLALAPMVWLACGGGEEPPPARMEPPSFPPWEAPATSALEKLVSSEPLSTLPTFELEEPEEDLVPEIDAIVAAWDPRSADRWNRMRRADLLQWEAKALHRMEHILRDRERPFEERSPLVEQIAALESSLAAGVLERVLKDLELAPILRANAAYHLARMRGDWIDEALLWKLDMSYQGGQYVKKDYYETDEYVSIWVAEGLSWRGILSGLDYLLDAERRASQGRLWTIYGENGQELTRNWCRHLLRQVVNRWSAPEHPARADEAPLELVQERVRELAQHWRQEGRAPHGPDEPVLTVDMNSRLALRLGKRMLEFPGRPLRPTDEARHILESLGAAALPMLELGLQDPDLFIREYTLDVVERLGPPARPLTPLLIALLGDPLTRCKALAALGAIGPGEELLSWQGLVLSPDPEIRHATAMALARSAPPRSRDVLIEAAIRLGPGDGGEYRAALATALVGVGRLEGPALWVALESETEGLDPLFIAPLLKRSRQQLVEREIAAPGDGEWPRERDELIAAMRQLIQDRGRAGPLD